MVTNVAILGRFDRFVALPCVKLQPGVQISIDLRQALEATLVAADIRQQDDGLQRSRPRQTRVGVPMNSSPTDAGKRGSTGGRKIHRLMSTSSSPVPKNSVNTWWRFAHCRMSHSDCA